MCTVYVYIYVVYVSVYMYTPSGDSTSSWGNRHGFALRRPHTSPHVPGRVGGDIAITRVFLVQGSSKKVSMG